MTLDKLELLTDSELHRRLLLCGFPNVPVTETTRKILINKLRNFMKSNKSIQPNFVSNDYHNIDRIVTKSELLPARENLLQKTAAPSESSNSYKRQKTEILYELPPIISDSSCEFRDVDDRENCFSNKMSGNIRVVNKLLKLREKTMNPKLCNKSANFESLTSVSCKQNNTTKLSHWLDWIIKVKQKFSKRGFKQTIVPYILIISLIMFLLTISIVYLIQQPSKNGNIAYELCYEGLSSNQACVNKEILGKGIEISKILQRTLSESAKNFNCNDADMLPSISFADFLGKNKFSVAELQAAEHIIEKNPQWNILIEQSGEKCDAIESPNCALSSKVMNFKLVDRKLQIKCSISRKIHRFFIVIGCFSIFALIIFITTYLAKLLKGIRLQKKETINKIVNEITNSLLVTTTQNAEDPPEIILNHLRDQLFPISQRKNIMEPWNEAIKLLEQSDSRVCFGSVFVNGEIYKTIKWNANRGASSDIFTKKWNSPAFDNTNRVIDPPTPCLKIRHMFDSSEANKANLKEALYGAILEKIDKSCQILDFQIDKQTCCVYIRCATEKDAGIIHKEINGWWFDKRLVSIKFLHLDRYLVRFPTPATSRKQN